MRSIGSKFIYGDGFYYNFFPFREGFSRAAILIPICPEVCISYYARCEPSQLGFQEINVTGDAVTSINEITMAYCKSEIFSATELDKKYVKKFLNGKRFEEYPYKYHDNQYVNYLKNL